MILKMKVNECIKNILLDVLSFPSFRSAFLKLDIGLTMNEIARLARQC